jgi:hypothetical protein
MKWRLLLGRRMIWYTYPGRRHGSLCSPCLALGYFLLPLRGTVDAVAVCGVRIGGEKCARICRGSGFDLGGALIDAARVARPDELIVELAQGGVQARGLAWPCRGLSSFATTGQDWRIFVFFAELV